MEELLIYLFKVSACTALFYGFYHFFLRKLTFFSVNRFYLLGTLIISLIIPFIEFQIQGSGYEPVQPVETTVSVSTNDKTVAVLNGGKSADVREVPIASVWEWKKIMVFVYCAVAAAILLSMLFQLLSVLWHGRHINQRIGKLKIIYKAEGFTNCSFLNYVFVDQRNMSENEGLQIIRHESVHVMCLHSVDKIIISLFKAILWFNPIIYLYDYALELAHEYEADKRTSSTIGNTSYANLLLAIAVKKNNPVLVHSFVKHPLKERLQMLFANESKHIKKLMYVAVLPIGIVLTCTFGIQVVYAKMPEIMPPGILDLVKKEADVAQVIQPQKKLKVRKVLPEQESTDSLLMIDYPEIEKIKELTIDGKACDKSILYKISPRCIDYNETRFRDGILKLTTRNGEIIYATEIDRYNKRTLDKSRATKKFYVRSTLKNQDGSKYDWIQIKMNGVSGGGGLSVKKGLPILLFIEGKRYDESVLKTIGNDEYAKGYGISFSSLATKDYKYGKKAYDSKIEIYKATPPLQTAVNMPLTFSAKDSVRHSDDKNIIHLSGAATIKYQYTVITADEIVYNVKNMTGVAKKAILADSRYADPGKLADSVLFDFMYLKFKSFGIKQ